MPSSRYSLLASRYSTASGSTGLLRVVTFLSSVLFASFRLFAFHVQVSTCKVGSSLTSVGPPNTKTTTEITRLITIDTYGNYRVGQPLCEWASHTFGSGWIVPCSLPEITYGPLRIYLVPHLKLEHFALQSEWHNPSRPPPPAILPPRGHPDFLPVYFLALLVPGS